MLTFIFAASIAATQFISAPDAEASSPSAANTATAQTSVNAPPPAAEPHRAPRGYALVFADEFNSGSQPDSARWAYDTHKNADGWYNNELQYYANARRENVRIENGNLVLEARRETLSADLFDDFGGQNYTSTRLFTQGKAAWTYGFFEVRAKLPCQRGSWPAIWMLPEDPDVVWPAGGEIDIMEHVGYDPTVIHHSVHTKAFNFGRNTQRTTSYDLPTACSQFHRYQLLWTPKGLLFGVDDTPKFYFEKKRSDRARWPFDQPMHLILNIAVGGDWGGRKGVDDAAFPAVMEIDHVRVYQLPSANAEIAR
ncbi:glycoside hydrolase family 16 protein [Pontixanthobacter sp.]|uniref:glycoside hydrolase family 16 protein n=1 Tax=Pontixanthobacter sp. TaxID=2792078 RepID=UPI003C7AF3B2